MHVLSLPMPIYVDDCALIGEDTAEVDAEMEAFHLRTWMQSQHQADPIMGVRSWDNFFDGIKVLSWVPAEPRRRCPIDVVGRIIEAMPQYTIYMYQMLIKGGGKSLNMKTRDQLSLSV